MRRGTTAEHVPRRRRIPQWQRQATSWPHAPIGTQHRVRKSDRCFRRGFGLRRQGDSEAVPSTHHRPRDPAPGRGGLLRRGTRAPPASWCAGRSTSGGAPRAASWSPRGFVRHAVARLVDRWRHRAWNDGLTAVSAQVPVRGRCRADSGVGAWPWTVGSQRQDSRSDQSCGSGSDARMFLA